jgi:copper transport protein
MRVAAHASFISSDPVDGSVLAAAPKVAELRFSEPVLLSASSVHLLHLGSNQDDDLHLTTSHGGTTLLATMPELDRGPYIIRYVAIDPADLHKTVGSISFGVGVAAPASESGEQVDSSWLSIALNVVADAALLVTVGAVVLAVLVVRRRQVGLAEIGRLTTIAGVVLEVAWIGLLLADAATVGFDNVRWSSLILSSDPGRRALVGLALTIGVSFLVPMLRLARDRSAQLFVVRSLAVVAAGFLAAAAIGGHAGIGGSFAVGALLRFLHLAALSVWIGAVAALWVVGRREQELRVLWPEVSTLAAIGLALTGATGLLLSGRVAVTITALLGTTYGQRIVVKAGLLVVLAVLGASASRRVRRGGSPRALPIELTVALAAVVFAALLASTAPARGERFLAAPDEQPQIVTSNVGDLTVSASIEPARPGPNLVDIAVLNTRRPAPGPIENANVRIEGADGSVVAERQGVPEQGPLEWTDIAIPSPGTYRVQVDVTRSVAPVSPFVATWKVDAAPVPRATTVVSTRSWAPIAAIAAAGWLVFVAAGWAAGRWLWRPAERSPSLVSEP